MGRVADLLSDQAAQRASATPIDLYAWMVLARELDGALCELNPKWFPCYGEEACIVGSFIDLGPNDVAAPHYRDPFIVYLMRGAEMWRLVAQVLGSGDGYSRGRSLPFYGPPQLGNLPWVAGDLGTSLGVATGAALALRERGDQGVCVCTFGDGTSNRGDLHEAVNIAALWKLPIVFLCQNNGWSISQPAASYLSAPVHHRASGYGIPGHAVDGQDVQEVRRAVREAIARARQGDGPSLIEARTCRYGGHWAGDDQAYRSGKDAAPDPLQVLADRLVQGGMAQHDVLAAMREEAIEAVLAAVNVARTATPVGPEQLGVDEVYA